jgi:gliding motility-associated-like protein
VTVTDINNCTSSESVNVNINLAPVACALPLQICLYEQAHLDAAACSQQGTTYSWLADSTLSQLNVADPIASPGATTTYTFIVSNSGCPPDTGTVTVTVHPLPFVTASPDTTILAGTSVQLTSIYNGTPYWSPGSWLDCIYCPDPLATPWLTTMYIITTVDSNGCRNTDTVLINVDDILTLYIPSAFTPIAYSTTNNIFYAYGMGIWEFEFYIFDRWGTLIFQTNDPAIGWDGTYKGQLVQSDVYGYLAKARSITGKSITRTGAVTGVR